MTEFKERTRLLDPAVDARHTAGAQASTRAVQRKSRTGLPDGLKAGVERLSGFSLDAVNVHYNSPRPAQLQAHAYTQGTEIHIAPGQARHLPHEAWHVVQQIQGRVRPTLQLANGARVNDEHGLEREADVMGARAAAVAQRHSAGSSARPLRAATAGLVLQAVGVGEWLGRIAGPLTGPSKGWAVASRAAGVARGAGSMVGGLGRLGGIHRLPGTYASTTTAALAAELQAGLGAAKANPNPGAPPIPIWLTAGQRRPVVGVAYVLGAGAPSFNAGHAGQYQARWARRFNNHDGRLPGVRSAGGYNEYYAQPTVGWVPAAGQVPWGSNRVLRQTNDPTGTYWWVTNDHYNTFTYVRDA